MLLTNNMIKVTVLFFATLKERAGMSKASLELPDGAQVKDFKAHLLAEHPALQAAAGTLLVAINREFAFDEDPVPDGAEIAVFPPVSGGSEVELPTLIAIRDGEIDLEALVAFVTLPTTGGVCLFVGTVRGVTRRDNPHETVYLVYEAYRPMAEAKMRQIAAEMRLRWPALEGIAIVQRTGRLDPGAPSVGIACSAAHRDMGIFEAAHYGIDRLKEIVPVWKKEVGPDGEEWVEGDYIPVPSD